MVSDCQPLYWLRLLLSEISGIMRCGGSEVVSRSNSVTKHPLLMPRADVVAI